MDVQQLRESRALQRPRPPRRRARCGLGSVPARSDRIRLATGRPSWPRRQRRTGDRALLEYASRWLIGATPARSARAWAAGIEARVRALLSEGEAAEALYRESIAQPRRHPPTARARPHPPSLRGVAAPRTPPPRRPNAAAHRATSMFTEHGHRGVRASAPNVELQATGEHARKRTVDTRRPAHPAGGPDLAPRGARSTPIERSPLSSSSARAPSSTTCARCSASST